MLTKLKAALGNRRHIRETGGDLIFTVINTVVLTLATGVVLYPLVFVFSASISDPAAVISGKVFLWPVGFTLMAYKAALEYKQIWTGLFNSVFYVVAGTIVNVAMTFMAAYPLSRRDLPGRTFLSLLFLFTMIFSGGLVPTYLLVTKLGLYNTRWALIIPSAINIFNLLITVTYLRTAIPNELLEASQLDGASDLQYLFHVALPLSTPILAVLALFYAVGHWNQFFEALIYLTNADLFPLQVILREILVQNRFELSNVTSVQDLLRRQGLRELLKYALIVITIVPVLIIYPFVQKHFVKGMLIGAIKG